MNIQVNENVIINLENVSSAMFEETKTIFNFNYSISLRGNLDRMIPDYVYAFQNDKEKAKIRKILTENNWLNFPESDNPNRYVNPKAISFIKYENRKKGSYQKYRIIMNLNTSVSLSNDIYVKTSDAVYADFFDKTEFDKAVKYIQNVLNVVKP